MPISAGGRVVIGEASNEKSSSLEACAAAAEMQHGWRSKDRRTGRQK
jgi:hypothetical protein